MKMTELDFDSQKEKKEEEEKDKTLPLLLKNLKVAFGKNITGPIISNTREYKATVRAAFLYDVVNFFHIRGGARLAAVNAWETDVNMNIAYHFISQIGREHYDSKITIIVNIPKNKLVVKSISKLFVNATVFETEISKRFGMSFEE